MIDLYIPHQDDQIISIAKERNPKVTERKVSTYERRRQSDIHQIRSEKAPLRRARPSQRKKKKPSVKQSSFISRSSSFSSTAATSSSSSSKRLSILSYVADVSSNDDSDSLIVTHRRETDTPLDRNEQDERMKEQRRTRAHQFQFLMNEDSISLLKKILRLTDEDIHDFLNTYIGEDDKDCLDGDPNRRDDEV